MKFKRSTCRYLRLYLVWSRIPESICSNEYFRNAHKSWRFRQNSYPLDEARSYILIVIYSLETLLIWILPPPSKYEKASWTILSWMSVNKLVVSSELKRENVNNFYLNNAKHITIQRFIVDNFCIHEENTITNHVFVRICIHTSCSQNGFMNLSKVVHVVCEEDIFPFLMVKRSYKFIMQYD